MEEQLAFLRTLKREMEGHASSSKYTSEQLKVMRNTYTYITSRIDAKGDLSELTPEWFIPWYELLVDKWKSLGEGSFGSVYQAKWLDSNVVVKEVILAGSSETNDTFSFHSMFSAPETPSDPEANASMRTEALKMFRREVGIWFRFSHPHVIRLFGACHVGRPFFVYEYAPNGTLVGFLRNRPDELWSKLYEAALGVQYLHARNVVHGDLKGNNIMIGSDMKAKVTDFGLSSISTDNSKPSISGAWHWVAPECIDHDTQPTFESDIYSLGMCIVEALRIVEAVRSGRNSKACLPWSCDINMVKYYVKRGTLPSRPTFCTDNEWELVKRMCLLDPQKRIKISTVVDELEKLTSIGSQEVDHCTNSLSTSINQDSILDVIDEARQKLYRLESNGSESNAVVTLYMSLCNHFENIYGKIEAIDNCECHTAFCTIVSDVNSATSKLKTSTSNLVSIAETTMRCYALRRRLDKLCDAYFIAYEMEMHRHERSGDSK